MCLLVLARNAHPRYPLVVVANRDEYHDREAEAAHWWRSPPMLAGRDRRAGGTWMGVGQDGRWGAVTNYRDGSYEPAPRSRGDIITGYLAADDIHPRDYLESLATRAHDYAGFSVVVGDASQLYYFSNRRAGITEVDAGIHTLSNHLLDTPWPKSERARLKLNLVLHKSRLEIEDLLAVLSDHEPFEDHELPTTGVGLEMERVLSPPFIRGDDYGTRCTTVLLFDGSGEVVFAEQGFLPRGARGQLVLQEFRVKGEF